jgi:hypothetical protein
MKVSRGARQPAKEGVAVELILSDTSQPNPLYDRLTQQDFVEALQQIDLTAKEWTQDGGTICG